MLRISFGFSLDTNHKGNRFSETLLEKGLVFVLNRGDNIISFKLGLVLCPIEVYPIAGKQSCKKDVLGARDTGRDKMILVLLIKIKALYRKLP